MKRFTKGTLPDTDVGPEKTGLDVWEKLVLKESLQTIRNMGRIGQLEAKQADLEQWLKALCSQSSQWITPRASPRVQSLSWRELANMSDWERVQLATQPIGPTIEQIASPYRENLSKITKLSSELEEDFQDVPRRIVRCAALEEELAALENSLEDEETEYLGWCVSLIRDVLDYNYPEDLTENHLGLLKNAIDLIHDRGSDCNKEDYQSIHKEFLQTGLALIPTTQKAIDKYGD